MAFWGVLGDFMFYALVVMMLWLKYVPNYYIIKGFRNT